MVVPILLMRKTEAENCDVPLKVTLLVLEKVKSPNVVFRKLVLATKISSCGVETS